MSIEAVLALVGMGLTVALFILTILFAVIGYLLKAHISRMETELSYVRSLERRMMKVEDALGIVRQPSPIVKMTPRGSA